MTSFVIVSQQRRSKTGELDGVLCDQGVSGSPNRKSGVPVKVKRISDQLLSVDGENRAIISCTSENGVTSFLINFSTQNLLNRERRCALEKAFAQVQQLATTLRPLRQSSEEPELATEGLGLLFNWIAEERERLMTAPRRRDDAIRADA